MQPKFKIITQQDFNNTVAERYFDQYESYIEFGKPCSISTREKWYPHEKLEQLNALGNTPSTKDIDRVMNNNSWTALKCDICDNAVPSVVQITTYVPDTCNICGDCLRKAMYAYMPTEEE